MATKHSKQGNIRFIYFDLGRVVVRLEGALAGLSRHSGKPIEEVTRVFDRYSLSACRGEYTSAQLWRIHKRELGFTHGAKDFATFWSEYLEPIPETHALIYELAPVVALGVLSNIEHGVFTKTVGRGGIPDIGWQSVIESCRIGHIKPEPEIFRVAEVRSGVLPQQLLLIDDRTENIEAALQRGWHGVVFDPDQIQQSVSAVRAVLGE